jgi:hypothetical protein
MAASSCRSAGPANGPTSPKAHKSWKERDFAGLWIGSRRDQPQKGLMRARTLLLDLRAGAAGGLGGVLELRGELGASRGSEGATVLCAPKPQAVVTRTAAVTSWRVSGAALRLQLALPEQSGETACGIRFPLGESCEGRGLSDGSIELSCGQEAFTLRRVSLTGTWSFDEERAERSGDTVVQRLRFHLVQADLSLSGAVDDIRIHMSGDEQNYRCNGRLRYDRQARHLLAGKLAGRQIILNVGAAEPKGGPCQGDLSLPETITGQWNPLEDRLVLKIGEDERSLWRRP